MPQPFEVEQALVEQKMGGVEKNFVEVLARMFDLDEGLLWRIVVAYTQAKIAAERLNMIAFPGAGTWEAASPELTVELRQALCFAVDTGVRRVAVRRAIERASPMRVDVAVLVPVAKKHTLCHGCPQSLHCVATSFSTPDKCYIGDKRSLFVQPLRILTKNDEMLVEVDAQQPAGRYIINIKHLGA